MFMLMFFTLLTAPFIMITKASDESKGGYIQVNLFACFGDISSCQISLIPSMSMTNECGRENRNPPADGSDVQAPTTGIRSAIVVKTKELIRAQAAMEQALEDEGDYRSAFLDEDLREVYEVLLLLLSIELPCRYCCELVSNTCNFACLIHRWIFKGGWLNGKRYGFGICLFSDGIMYEV